MARVLLAYPLADPDAEARLAREVEVVRADGAGRTEFLALLSDVDGVIVQPPARLDAAALAAARALRVIANSGTGLDHIDVAAARRRGIQIVSGAGANARAVAEYVLCVMVMANRRLDAAMEAARDPGLDWSTRIDRLCGHELRDRTLGIVGFGAIGQALAEMAHHGLGMRVAVYDPYLTPSSLSVAQVCTTLDEVLDVADTLSVHVPLTEATRHLIGAGELARLGRDGVLVNSSQGGVVDEDAVVEALRAGQLRAAAWDVFEQEPPEPARIAELAGVPGLILTPHIAGISYEAGSVLSWRAVEGVLAVLSRSDRHPGS
jgi:phosphoglycerate dehydrogenase-like enzyme